MQFGAGITASNLSFSSADGLTLTISLLNANGEPTGDQIVIERFLSNVDKTLETINFHDGSHLSFNQVVVELAKATEQGDVLYGSYLENSISGLGGDDSISTGGGNDTIDGGKGNDRLEGGHGNDIYLFNLGDGQDVIIESSGSDKIKFGAGITAANLTFSSPNGVDVIISIVDAQGVATGDQITITSMLRRPKFGFDFSNIETLEFADGSSLSDVDIFSSLTTGTNNSEVLYGSYRSDTINGFSGDDVIYGREGDDIIAGGVGNDVLQGGDGQDTYLFNIGDGQDVIKLGGRGQDKIQFGPGVSKNNLSLSRLANGDVVVVLLDEHGKATGDKITIKNMFRIWDCILTFADGSELSVQDADSMMTTGTTEDDSLYGTGFAETMSGLQGNDTIYAGSGNDIITGGLGNDFLYGGYGDDKYVFNLGDGQDTISDRAGTDFIEFGAGISRANLTFSVSNKQDIIIHLLDDKGDQTGDTLTLKNAFSSSENYIETIRLSDGTQLQISDIAPSLQSITGSEGDDTLRGTDQSESLFGLGGNDVLESGFGNDLVVGGKGNDRIVDTKGNEIYVFNFGDGQDQIVDSDGNDVIRFGAGITRANVQFSTPDRSSILITLVDNNGVATGDSILLENALTDPNYQLEIFEFSNGDDLSKEYVLSSLKKLIGDNNNNALNGTHEAESLYGYGGNDVINGGYGDDIISGGKGDDILYGGEGGDTYLFGFGDGNDVISDDSGFLERFGDVIEFGEGITKDNLSYRLINSQDILITLLDDQNQPTGDSITVKNMFVLDSVGKLVFADGSVLSRYTIFEDLLVSTEQDDTIYGSFAADHLKGLAGDDTIYGRYGNDQIEGGTGNDILNGGAGSDTYLFNLGDGHDTIIDEKGYYDYDDLDFSNKIQFGEGITRSNLSFEIVNTYDVKIIILDDQGSPTGDSVTIKQLLVNTTYGIHQILFADGSNMSLADMFVELTKGSNEDDTIYGSYESDRIAGLDGDDIIDAKAGDDIITGGKGNDVLAGWYGDDTYVFNLGDGQDTINDWQGSNNIKFGDGITISNLLFTSTNGKDLIITLIDSQGNPTGDSIIIKNTVSRQVPSIAQIYFANGSSLSSAEMFSKLAEGTNGDDTLYGTSADDTINGLDGNDSIYTASGNDTIIGGEGNDVLEGGYGNDIYVFNLGDGQDTINDWQGSNSLKLGDGITASNLLFTSTNGEDVIISLTDNQGNSTGDSITIKSMLSGSSSYLAQVQFSDGTSLSSAEIFSKFATGTNDNDTLYGSGLADTINGLAGDDSIYANNGNDTIIGGEGNDVLEGGYGNDTYVFNLGDGQDTINDTRGTNILKFGDGITASNLLFTSTDSQDLIVRLVDAQGNPTGDTIFIESMLSSPYYGIAQIQFSDGSSLSRAEINLSGTDDNDTLYGSNQADTINGLAGDDSIYANNGNDTIIGGEGNDVLEGGYGDDTYVFNLGDGQDTINDTRGTNILKFGDGITTSNLLFTSTDSQDLIVRLVDAQGNPTGDSITIANMLSNPAYGIAQIQFSDGTSLSRTEVFANLSGTGSNDTLYGSILADTINGLAGDDSIYANHGDDTIIGGEGNDVLEGGNGNDTYVFNLGDGQDTINDTRGANILKLGDGITASNLLFTSTNGQDVVVRLVDAQGSLTGDSIIITNMLSDQASRIAQIQFSNGSSLSSAEILSKLAEGTSGDDTLYGTSGDDTIIGGEGNDVLVGGDGDDTYVFNLGDGQDTINDSQGANSLQFGDGITASNLLFTSTSGQDLIVRLVDAQGKPTGDTITIEKILSSSVYGITQIKFSDGTSLSRAEMLVSISGTDGNDTLYGSSQADTINGLAGNDTIYADDGDDTIIGGEGNDVLEGGYGDDTYVFNLGDGQDTINDSKGTNSLQFGDGITASNLLFTSTNGQDLIVRLVDAQGKPTGDTITIEKIFSNSAYGIAQIKFSDGTSLSRAEVLANLSATDNNDVLYGSGQADTINGLAGDDTLYGYFGDDTIIGGEGNDVLEGGYGDDTYVFNLGDGQDVITDENGTDTIQFGDGITASNLLFTPVNRHDLIITLVDSQGNPTGDSIIINDMLSSPVTDIDRILFTDGSSLSQAEMFARLSGSDSNDILHGSVQADTLNGLAGDDTLYGYFGDDTIIGGEGNDALEGGYGNDTYVFNIGDGQDVITEQNGTDTIQFGGQITLSSIAFIKKVNSSDLFIRVLDEHGNSTGDQITVRNMLSSANSNIEHLTFSDGSSLNHQDIMSRLLIEGSDFNDNINGTSDADTIYGLAGKDTINSGDGDDTLIGGTGNDILNGGQGDDTYIFNLGDGRDEVDDSKGVNTLEFGDGITESSLLFTATKRGDLIIRIVDNQGNPTGDSIKVNNMLYSYINGIGKILFSDGSSLSEAEILSKASVGTDKDDILYGSSEADTLNGLAGNDSIYASSGDDIITGGEGNDVLNGGSGNDTYVFNVGDGQDKISDDKGANKIKFGAGISESNLQLIRRSAYAIDIVLVDENGTPTGDQVKVENMFYSLSTWVIEFSDGSVLNDFAYLESLPIVGTEGNDRIDGDEENDTISGLGGNDRIYGDYGDDILSGNEGDDKIQGSGGQDTLIGGQGNDTLKGGAGNDTYIFNLGDGQDVITDKNGVNTLEFGAGITAANLSFIAEKQNLKIVLLDDQGNQIGDQIVVKNMLKNASFAIDQITFADGSTLSQDEILAQVPKASSVAGSAITQGQNEINEAEVAYSLRSEKWLFDTEEQSDFSDYGIEQIQAMPYDKESGVGTVVITNPKLDKLISAMGSFDAPSHFGGVSPYESQQTEQLILVENFNNYNK